MSSFEDPFEQAQRFVEAHWIQFADPAGVTADIAELKCAVSGTGPANPIRIRLTMHRLNRICGHAAPVAALLSAVRETLATAR